MSKDWSVGEQNLMKMCSRVTFGYSEESCALAVDSHYSLLRRKIPKFSSDSGFFRKKNKRKLRKNNGPKTSGGGKNLRHSGNISFSGGFSGFAGDNTETRHLPPFDIASWACPIVFRGLWKTELINFILPPLGVESLAPQQMKREAPLQRSISQCKYI